MKKLFLLAAMMVATLSASAQARFQPGTFTIQPRLGGTGSMWSNAQDMYIEGNEVEPTASGGSFIGVDVEYYLSERFSLAAGLNWAEAGCGWENYKYYVDGIKMKVEETAQRNGYINMPLTANWYVAKGLALKTGIQLSFLTNAELYTLTKFKQSGVKHTLITSDKNKDAFKTFDLAIPIGISYEFKIPIVLDLRYNIGLLDVNKKNLFGDESLHNMQATFTVGYKFKL